jgi:PAS domain-containing protein
MTGAALILIGPLVAALALWNNRHLDHRHVLVPVLSLSVLMACLASVALLCILVKARSERARSDERAGRLSNAVHQTADAVFITDRSGVIEYINPAFRGSPATPAMK